MTIRDAISRVDGQTFNTCSQDEKVQWLSQLDASVKTLVIDTHAGGSGVVFTGYNENTSPETQLLVQPPFDVVYLYWLTAQIHRVNDENEKYSEAIILYDTAFEAFQKHYNRTHMPLGAGCRFRF